MILVLCDMLGVCIVRDMLIFGYDDVFVGYFEIVYENVCVFVENILFGEGCGFEIV